MGGWTKGPWVVGVSADNGIHCVDAETAGGLIEICEVWGTDDDKEETSESKANARLIAEALRKALQAMQGDWERTRECEEISAILNRIGEA